MTTLFLWYAALQQRGIEGIVPPYPKAIAGVTQANKAMLVHNWHVGILQDIGGRLDTHQLYYGRQYNLHTDGALAILSISLFFRTA